MRCRSSAPNGGLVIWKPRGPTSRSIIDQIQQRLAIDGLGHCGTLDPLASGLLVIIGGVARRFQEMLTVHNKSYEATIWFGISSVSGDAEGPLSCPYPRTEIPSLSQVEQVLPEFLGLHSQVPPVHSAIRIGRRRSYERARAGDHTPPPSRQVLIHSLSIIELTGPRLRLRVDCGPGTYIRSLARDLGARLGCPSSLMALRRIGSGVYSTDDAVLPDRVIHSDWLSLEQLLARMPRIDVDQQQATRLGHGQFLSIDELEGNMVENYSDIDGERLVVWCQDQVRGIARIQDDMLRSCRWIPDRAADPVSDLEH